MAEGGKGGRQAGLKWVKEKKENVRRKEKRGKRRRENEKIGSSEIEEEINKRGIERREIGGVE